jgi:hypothetical protein
MSKFLGTDIIDEYSRHDYHVRMNREYEQKLRELSSRIKPTTNIKLDQDTLVARLLNLESNMNSLSLKLDEALKMNEYLKEIIDEEK